MSTASLPLTGTYAADPIHSSLGFAITYMGVSTFRGTFDEAQATLQAGPDGVSLTGTANVESISIRTPEQFRAHVLGEQFFAADAHPEIRFSSDQVTLEEDGSVTVSGQLTIRGVTRPITALGTWSPPATDPTGRSRSHLALAATVDRRQFGMTWAPTLPNGGSALADQVAITAELALVAQEQPR
jgi:polyisoprenoid-binding protein YceI